VSRGFVHDIDPIIATVGSVQLWWAVTFPDAEGFRRTRPPRGVVFANLVL
jgi:hypothetical protein